jgi:hypothetical protein
VAESSDVVRKLLAEARARIGQDPELLRERAAIEQRRVQIAAMDLPTLREAAMDRLRASAACIRSVELTDELLSHGWTTFETERLATKLESLASNIEAIRPSSTTNMSRVFDDIGVRGKGSDVIQDTALECTAFYNEYVRRYCESEGIE